MDAFSLYRSCFNRLRLFVLYWRRIVFAPNHFKVGPLTKLRANLGGGFLADQWALYSLDGKKKKEYLSEFDWYRSRYINEPFDQMLNNKVVATEVLRQYVRVPEVYLVKTRAGIVDAGHCTGDGTVAVETLRQRREAFMKPFGKGKGNGVHRLRYDGQDFWVDQQKKSAEDMKRMFEKEGEWYLSETITQHAYAAGLYGKTCNTIRMITLRDPDSGKIKLFFAVQRVGTAKTIPVDNASQGGLVCKIDLETGRLSHAGSLHTTQIYEEHPDSGIRFDQVVIPDWEQTKAEIVGLAESLPFLHFVAWDVVKMEDGTNCVIEANTSSGVNIIQLWGGQRHGELGNFYRKHGVIR